ncbi:MAG: hypothetical protein LAT67_03500 [Balneolales bacterium]|nr:hypothetical protein [Balneolales bacterium]
MTDILKLFFEHDIRLEQLSDEYDARKDLKRSSTLEEFLRPVPTYSKFYFTGSTVSDSWIDFKFGLSALNKYKEICDFLQQTLDPAEILCGKTSPVKRISEITPEFESDTFVLIPGNMPGSLVKIVHEVLAETSESLFNSGASVREKIGFMKPVLDAGVWILFIEKAHHGIDFHLFSKENIYELFFGVFQPLTTYSDFRFFSINGKRAKSERLFYFETWTLDNPPHGFEEVFPETRLR